MNLNLGRSIIIPVFFSLAMTGTASAESHDKKAVVPSASAGKAPLGVTVAETELLHTGRRASKLIGTKVENDSGDKIGEIDDLIVTPDDKLTVAIVEVGGFLGLGKHPVAIPVRQFTQIAPKVILAGATKEALKKLPPFVNLRY